jgi:hypothetical protein
MESGELRGLAHKDAGKTLNHDPRLLPLPLHLWEVDQTNIQRDNQVVARANPGKMNQKHFARPLSNE